MNRRNLPFTALRAFEAAARHASVSGAAAELSVTHCAVSHQLKRLEQDLGITLFQRTNRGLRITAQGASLLPVLVESFDCISTALDNIRQSSQTDVLKVTCTPSFASKWLVPRLADWYAKPDASRIHLIPSLNFLDFKADDVDIAIRCGIPPWNNLQHELLMPVHLVAVCSPDYAGKNGLLGQPADAIERDLIHADVDDHDLGEEWCQWLSGCGVSCPDLQRGLSFRDPALAMQAAADGLGLAIGYLELIDRDLESGRLVKACELSIRHQFSYYLVSRRSPSSDNSLLAFHKWILNQV